MTTPVDAWAVGAAYERYVGRWSRPVAEQFLTWLAIPGAASWLDVGCGTGALSATIEQHASPARVCGVDPSLPFLQQAQRRTSHVRVTAGRAEQLPMRARAFDVVVSALALNFVPSPENAVRDMSRVVCTRGVVAAYVWDYADGMQMMRHFWDAVVSLDPEAQPLDEARRFPLCHPDRLAALFREAGLAAVETRAIEVPTRFADFDDYWSPFLGGQGPAPGYVTQLSEDRRRQLRDTIHRRLPAASDGSIALTARAWAVRGTRETP